MKKKKIIIVLSLLMLVLTNCRTRDKGIPEDAVNIIPPEILINMIYDIHIADAILLSETVKFEEENIDSIMYNSLFMDYGYTRQDFDNTILYYSHYNLDSLDLLYMKVMDSLQKEKGEIIKL